MAHQTLQHRRRFLKTLSALLPGLVISVPATSATMQKQGVDKAILIKLLDIIDQVGIILPGEGFKSIKLGDPVEKLVRLWGKPKRLSRDGATLSYLLSQNTVIHFVKRKQLIDKIIVSGRAGSLAHVKNGTVFGMSQNQVLAQFPGTPDKLNRQRIRYDALGIELRFASNRLAEIEIFKKKAA